jgi:hypothetical protein
VEGLFVVERELHNVTNVSIAQNPLVTGADLERRVMAVLRRRLALPESFARLGIGSILDAPIMHRCFLMPRAGKVGRLVSEQPLAFETVGGPKHADQRGPHLTILCTE